jgi:NADH-quinone oxidoreductase subunit H
MRDVQLISNPDIPFVIFALIKILVILFGLLGVVSYLILVERKVCGRMQWRYGPNRVGPFGLLQPIADVIKLLFKEEFIPGQANRVIYHIAPMLAIVPALITFSIIPIGPDFLVADINVGLLLFLAMSSISVYAVTLAGWSSNSKYALIGGLRSSAQMISYELAMGLSTIGVLLLAGSLSTLDIVHAQQKVWFILFQPIGFLIFIITALAETNRAPFDLPEAEAELVAGFHTEYSSMKWGLFFLGEYAAIITICSIAVTLFLGGWNGPPLPDIQAYGLHMSLKFIWFFLKLGALIFLFIWLRWTFPRLRYDQLMNLGWKVLLPLSLANVVVTAIVIYGMAR